MNSMKKFLFGLILLSGVIRGALPSLSTSLPIKKVIIWGHKLHTHTHSYIHWGFYRAFQHLGFDTYWFDSNDKPNNFDFSGSLFISEWQVDRDIPIREDCFYLIHNMYESNDLSAYARRVEKYRFAIDNGRACNFRGYQVGKRDEGCDKLDNYTYYSLAHKTAYILWATDLLPYEIDQIKRDIVLPQSSRAVYWIGTIGGGTAGNINELEPFKRACNEHNITFVHKKDVSAEENMKLVQESYLAPAIQGAWQVEHGYIPCRIFKNISYGQLGVTNSREVYELFGKKIVYNSDTYQLFYDAKKKLETLTVHELYEQMDFVKENHTYINRIQSLLHLLEMMHIEALGSS